MVSRISSLLAQVSKEDLPNAPSVLDLSQLRQRDAIERANSDVEKIENLSRLTRSLSAASDSYQTVVDMEQASRTAATAAEMVKVVSNTTGLTTESRAWTSLLSQDLMRRTGITLPTQLSFEALSDFALAARGGAGELKTRYQTARQETIGYLSAALARTQKDLSDLQEAQRGRTELANGQVVVGDGPIDFLNAEGSWPTDLSDHIAKFAELVGAVLGPYQTAAEDTAVKAAFLAECFDARGVEAFWEALQTRLTTIDDPRTSLTPEQLTRALPGCGALFSPATPSYTGDCPVRKRLDAFIQGPRPAADVMRHAALFVAPDDPKYQAPILPLPAQIGVTTTLMRAISSVNTDQLARLNLAHFNDLSGQISVARDRYLAFPESMRLAIDFDPDMIDDYLNVVYGLVSWPILNTLCSLVFVSNAWLLYAQRCLAATTAAVTDPDASPETSSEPPTTEPPAAEPTADSTPVEPAVPVQ